ncbi:MAG: glutamate cyclase domain-containing protein, partial [Nocardioides sp.]
MQDWARGLADLAATDTGRGSAALARAVPDDLGAAARLLAGALISAPDRVAVGIVTGFFIPRADPPAAETDGPLGAVLLALTVAALGGRAVVLTDERCAGVVEATLAEGLARA